MTRVRFAVVVALLLIVSGCSSSPPVRDVPASLVAVLGSNAPGDDLSASSFCAGVLTAPDIVTTAAHCLADRDPERIDVQVSADNVCAGSEVGGERLHVIEVRTDPVLDLAELVLESPAQSSPAQSSPAQSSPAKGASGEASSLTAWGWGTGSIGGASPCEAAPKSLVEVTSGECAVSEPARYGDFLCVVPVEGGPNTCAGDSGGPVFDQRGRLVAITVAGIGCGPDDPGIYLRLPLS